MNALAFEGLLADVGLHQSDYIRKHGPLPTDKQVRVGSRVILPGRVTNVSPEREGHDS
jgi:hypothetical protein